MMESISPFLTADGYPISIGQALSYLESSGKLNSVLWEIMRQYVIEKELQASEELDIGSDLIEQAVIDFRLERQLTTIESFQAWLANERISYPTFREKVVFDLKLEKLKFKITKVNLEEYFIKRKLHLDQVVLSRLVVEEQTLAEELKSQILEDGIRFEHLAQEYSIAEDSMLNGMMGAISKGAMPDDLRMAIDLAESGELIGPLQIEELWYLFRVEKLLPASLNESLKQALEDELFEQWLEEKIERTDVQLKVDY
jgi:parvulin-like peptidyl-prolyl isomerase